MSTRYRLFVSVTPGLEGALQGELQELAILPSRFDRYPGGIELSGDASRLRHLCRDSRLAEGVRVRVGKPFVARDFATLEAGVAHLSWHAFLARDGAAPRVRVHCERSRLYHTQAVAERVIRSVARALGLKDAAAWTATRGGAETKGVDASTLVLPDAPLLFVRIVRDRVQLSIDAAGAPLHQRGYRTHIGKAPLRETLAAACIHATGYRGRRPLWDPFCGAGTLLLEALAQARGVVPGAARSFAFEAWPSLAGGVQDPDVGALAGASVAANALVMGSDHDPRALEAARANATRVGLEGAIRWIEEEPRAVSAAVPRDAIVVCNPPYGKRLGKDRPALQAAYRALSEVLVRRRDLDAWVLTGSPLLVRAGRGLDWEIAASFSNRGVPVRLYHLRP